MIAGILLCAGFGTRLKPITDTTPKPAIPFCGHPLVWYSMAKLQDAGITALAANVHYLPDIMASTLQTCAIERSLPPVKIFRENDEILGTGGGSRGCIDLLPDADTFVICHADVICGVNLSDVIQSHINAHADVTLVVAPRSPDQENLGMVGTNNEQIVRIRDWYAKGYDAKSQISPCCFTGIHIVTRDILQKIPTRQNTCLVTQIYPDMMSRGLPIHAYETDAFFADVGTHETFRKAEHEMIARAKSLSSPQDMD